MSAEIKSRLRNKALEEKIMTAQDAASMIKDGMTLGVSGFTPSGYPKQIPLALAERAGAGEKIKVSLCSGASLGPEIDEAWTKAGIIARRMPYQTSAALRDAINSGSVCYTDVHLSHAAQQFASNPENRIHIAIIEASAITEEGNIVPSTSVGNSPTFVEKADAVLIELNLSTPEELEQMVDIYKIGAPPHRRPIPIIHSSDRIGLPYIPCEIEKISGIVITDDLDKTRDLTDPDETSIQISRHILDFFRNEVKHNRLGPGLLPLQSGVGSVANAVLYGLCDAEFENLSCYTEVVQDSMLDLLRSGKAHIASATAVSPSPKGLTSFLEDINFFKDRIILRPQEISNHPEVVRRLGVIAMNTAVEADIYGNVNSTHVSGSKMLNGIGGSGDFARNAAISIFITNSTAKGGKLSSIVPMVTHVDHTEHDVMVLVTEQGYADLRGLCPRERAEKIIENCCHPDFKEPLRAYYEKSLRETGGHTPHRLDEAFSWHVRFQQEGKMLPRNDV